MKNHTKILILSMFLLNACAPKAQQRQFPRPTSGFGPRIEDTDLSARLKTLDAVKPELSWKGTVPTAVFFQQAENLMVLGKHTAQEALINKGLRWVETFYKQPQTSSYADFSKSPFTALATTQSEEEVQKTLDEVNRDLDRSRKVLKTEITALGSGYVWPQKGSSLTTIITHAEIFTNSVARRLDHMGLPKVISDGIRVELKKQTSDVFADVHTLAKELYAIKLFSKALQYLEATIVKFKVTLPVSIEKSLDQGRLLAKDLDTLKDAQAGLTVLIDIWSILSVEEREAYFKTEHQSLYDFLSKQDAKELSCLRAPDCGGGLINGIAKKLFILPQIKEYGVEKLHAKLNEKTLKFLLDQIESFAQEFVSTLPMTFVSKIDQGLVDENRVLQGIQKNYSGYLKDLIAEWADTVLPSSRGKVPGFEASALNLQVSSKNKFTLAPVGSASELRANTAGSSMTANALFLQHSRGLDDFKMRMALSQINKLIAMGGYRDDAKKLVPALMMPVETTQASLDLMTFTKSHISYGMPDKIKMLDSFQASAEPYEKDFSAAAYAEQLKGLSEMINFTADWKRTGFEDSLGKIKAQELISEIENPSLDRALFPKDMFFALNIGDAAVLLKNITKKATPVFLITLNNKTIWADQYQPGGVETPIMAGLVDIKDGERSRIVNTQDVAKFMLAIREFLKATEGVEDTRASLLLEKDEYGVTPLQVLLEGREDLKLLTIALANFVSSQLMNKDSVIQSSFHLDKMEKAQGTQPQIEDQAFAIRALISAWETTGMEVYLWSAHEIYFAMNKAAFDHEERFYVNGDGSSLSFPQKVNTLRALVELKASLQPESQKQLELVIAPWMKALEELR